eukprot:GFYU01005818.1.p1 GENE.GFYU01005818.1~~GFYU01005818.1.p1  ORF type:complete len:805 (-),score=202.28 GFYU01005818.1:184-2598(-)
MPPTPKPIQQVVVNDDDSDDSSSVYTESEATFSERKKPSRADIAIGSAAHVVNLGSQKVLEIFEKGFNHLRDSDTSSDGSVSSEEHDWDPSDPRSKNYRDDLGELDPHQRREAHRNSWAHLFVCGGPGSDKFRAKLRQLNKRTRALSIHKRQTEKRKQRRRRKRAARKIQAFYLGWRTRKIWHERIQKQKRRRMIAMEIIETEKAYVNQISRIVGVQEELESSGKVLKPDDIALVFGSIKSILQTNKELLGKLVDRIKQQNGFKGMTMLGDIFCEMSPYLKVYKSYARGYGAGSERLKELTTKDKKFIKWCAEHSSHINAAVDLMGLLITPIQRVPRYQLLLRDLDKHTWYSHPDKWNLEDSLAKITEVAKDINEDVRRTEEMTRVMVLRPQTIGWEHLWNMWPPSRTRILATGALNKITSRRVVRTHYFLFSDILIYCQRDSGGRYEFRGYHDMDRTWIQSIDDTDEFQNAFQIVGQTKTWIVYADTPDDKETWMNKIQDVIDEQVIKDPSVKDNWGVADEGLHRGFIPCCACFTITSAFQPQGNDHIPDVNDRGDDFYDAYESVLHPRVIVTPPSPTASVLDLGAAPGSPTIAMEPHMPTESSKPSPPKKKKKAHVDESHLAPPSKKKKKKEAKKTKKNKNKNKNSVGPYGFPIPKNDKMLYYMQSNREKRTAVYSINTEADGSIAYKRNPVKMQWYNRDSPDSEPPTLFESGERKSYGIQVKKATNDNGFHDVNLLVYPSRRAELGEDSGGPGIFVQVAGSKCRLLSMYVEFDDSGFVVKMTRLSIRGLTQSGQEVTEELV